MTLGATSLNKFFMANDTKVVQRNDFVQNNLKTSNNIFSISNSQTQSEDLRSKFQDAKDKQGFMGKLWNGFKNLTGLGLSTNKIEEKIKQYENGKISYEEVEKSIASYEQKQNSMVDMFSSIASGFVVMGSAILTSGTSLLASAAIGGAAKAVLKTADRSTNNVKGDEINLKQIGKDVMTGSVEGVITTATMGMGTAIKSVAGQSVKEAIKQGAVQGAKCGAIAGGAMGTTNYTADAVFEKDVDFSLSGALKSGAQGAVIGGVLGGILGGATNGIKQAKFNRSTQLEQIHDSSKGLSRQYDKKIKSVEKEYKKHFDNLDSVEEVTARAKSQSSIERKLVNKLEDGKLTVTDLDSCSEAIGDGYGARVQLKSITSEKARSIVDKSLKGTGKTYDDFILALESNKTLPEEYITVLDNLKEAQADEMVDALCQKIKSGQIQLTDEFNNYGDEVTSYFSNKQLRKIALSYKEATGQEPTLINKTMVEKDVTFPEIGDAGDVFTTNTNKAVKVSGYPTAQANAISNKTTGVPLGDTEFQIRGTEVNTYSDIEHIAYDIRQGKILPTDQKYADVYEILKGMSKESYEEYCKYSASVYRYLRLKELGIQTTPPVSPTTFTYTNQEGLIKAGLSDILSKANQNLTEEEIGILLKRRLLNYIS